MSNQKPPQEKSRFSSISVSEHFYKFIARIPSQMKTNGKKLDYEQSLFFLRPSNKTGRMQTPVTEGARRESPRFTRPAASPLDALSHAWLTDEKRETARSLANNRTREQKKPLGPGLAGSAQTKYQHHEPGLEMEPTG